ncbi:MAG: C40 family peptidase [Bifidobacteriaceae bacterium]|jgi:cell wall-associated NlpC family hydrolase|nr:C40 family peptidase [Bifidobacteriaceae bacterium]
MRLGNPKGSVPAAEFPVAATRKARTIKLGRRRQPAVGRVSVRRRPTLLVASLVAVFTLANPALADPPAPGGSDAAVSEARRQEQLAAASVAEVEAMLVTLASQTDQAAATAGAAAEAYNKAQEELTAATELVEQAEAEAAASGKELSKARGTLARVVLMNSQNGSDIAQLEPLLSSDGLEEAIQKSAMLQVVGSAADRAAARFALAQQTAEQDSERAKQAAELRQDKAASAESKAAAAQQAAEAAVRAQTEAATQHEQLLQVLADKRQTTVEAERSAEERRQRERDEEERRQREADPPPQLPDDPPPNPPSDPPPNPPSDPPPNPPSDPPPDPPTEGSEAGLAAVAWARAQIGKPYQWGGNGPNSFDCSGLVQQAWLKGGGKSIPRVAADQYYVSTKIPYDQMRPGDLIFWGSDLHHVAIYSGNGNMIEAPSSGLTIREIPIRWSGTVKYAGRV